MALERNSVLNGSSHQSTEAFSSDFIQFSLKSPLYTPTQIRAAQRGYKGITQQAFMWQHAFLGPDTTRLLMFIVAQKIVPNHRTLS